MINYTYTLTLHQNGCTITSAPYPVTVHNLPSEPTLQYSVFLCNPYQIKLGASSSTPYDYSWSNGMNGSTILVDRGGPYRVWNTDQYGCKNTAEIDVPLSPNTWFWRYPIGCYDFCDIELPKWVNGPAHVRFPSWAWNKKINGTYIPVTPNHNEPGSGQYSECSRFWLDIPPQGSGTGQYAWWLNNGNCNEYSDELNLFINYHCCQIPLEVVRFDCTNGVYSLQLNANNTGNCSPAYYNLYITDSQGNAIGNITVQSPTTLISALNPIYAGIQDNLLASPAGSQVTISIEAFCNSSGHCTGSVVTTLPDCGQKKGNLLMQDSITVTSKSLAELKIIPNPANTFVNINYCYGVSSQTSNRQLIIYEALGKPVYQEKINRESGNLILDIQDYIPGVYFVELKENDARVLVKKVIINH